MVSPTYERLGGGEEKLSQRLTRIFASPFGTWSNPQNRSTAIAILSVYGIIFIAGLIGHVCIVAYACSSRRKVHSSRRGALLILANLSCSQMVFLLCCLPSIAYQAIMKLTYEPWVLTDVVCRMIPFLELFLLGVTAFSFFVLSIDRLRSAWRISKSHEESRDSCLTESCKMIVIWVGAMIIASPEIFVHGTSNHNLSIPQRVFEKLTEMDPNILLSDLPSYYKLNVPEYNPAPLNVFLERLSPGFSTDELDALPDNITTFAMNYQYHTCEQTISLWAEPPKFLVGFIQMYYEIRLWWIFGFYFCLPVFFSLISALIVALKLSRAHDQCTKEHGNYPVECPVGTLTSHKGSLNRSNSISSNQTLSSEAQQLMSAEGRHPIQHSGSLRQNTNHQQSASPVTSNRGGPMTPMIVRACHTPLSPAESHIGYPQSPLASPSTASHLYENGGTNPRQTSSLPPHGRGTRGRSRMQKLIMSNISADRSMNTLLVALLLAFSLSWLPQHIFHILFAKTQIQSTLDPLHISLIMDICRYLSAFSFALNPIVIYLSYKPYRLFLDRICCQCRCC